MAVAATTPVLPNQKKNSVAKSPDSLMQPVHVHVQGLNLMRDEFFRIAHF